MANEIQATCSLSISKNSVTASGSMSATTTLSGNVFQTTIQNIGTTREAITVPADFTLGGWMLCKNTDSTNFVYILISDAAAGVATTVAKLLPGEACLWKPHAGAAPFAHADTAAVDLAITWTEL